MSHLYWSILHLHQGHALNSNKSKSCSCLQLSYAINEHAKGPLWHAVFRACSWIRETCIIKLFERTPAPVSQKTHSLLRISQLILNLSQAMNAEDSLDSFSLKWPRTTTPRSASKEGHFKLHIQPIAHITVDHISTWSKWHPLATVSLDFIHFQITKKTLQIFWQPMPCTFGAEKIENPAHLEYSNPTRSAIVHYHPLSLEHLWDSIWDSICHDQYHINKLCTNRLRCATTKTSTIKTYSIGRSMTWIRWNIT